MRRRTDIPVDVMAEFIQYLAPDLPVTTEKDVWGTGWYVSQKSHMYGWVGSQDTLGSGNYSRKTPNKSTKTMYNRFLNPGGLLWLAEALGEDEERLRRAADRAIAIKDDVRQRCVVFREVIPFSRILELFNNPAGWRYDPALEPYYRMGEDGWPVLTSVKFYDALRDELK